MHNIRQDIDSTYYGPEHSHRRRRKILKLHREDPKIVKRPAMNYRNDIPSLIPEEINMNRFNNGKSCQDVTPAGICLYGEDLEYLEVDYEFKKLYNEFNKRTEFLGVQKNFMTKYPHPEDYLRIDAIERREYENSAANRARGKWTMHGFMKNKMENNVINEEHDRKIRKYRMLE